MGTEEPSRLEEHLQKGPDWDRLLALANGHGVIPLLYRALNHVDHRVMLQKLLEVINISNTMIERVKTYGFR